jgi:germination protein YpeB
MIKSRRGLIRAVSFITTLVVALGIWGSINAYKLSQAEKLIKISNERALTQLGTYLDDITLNLQKSMYVNGGDLLSRITSDLWRSSVAAKECLTEITGSDTQVSGIYKYLSQVGEYTLSLNRKLSSGQRLTAEETDNINKLLQYSRSLSNTVNYLIEQEESGALDFEEIQTTLMETESESLYLGTQLNDAEQTLSDYPTLIYDGPFSDHITDKKSKLLEGKKEISEEDALLKAAEFTGEVSDNLKLLNYTEGNMPSYTFYSDKYTISVTKRGGYVCYMLTSDFAGEISLTCNDDIMNLFRMTPYYYKTGREESQKLMCLNELEVTVHFGVEVYRKR